MSWTDAIDVAIACGDNSEAYAEFLVWSVNKTATRPDRFRYLLGLNNPGVDRVRLEKLKDVADVDVFEAYSGMGYCSESHGITLGKTFERVETEISMVCDVDIAFVGKGWDDLYIAELDKGHTAVGPEYARDYDKKGGHLKHLGFPNLLATMVRTPVMRKYKVDFLPASDLELTERDAPFYGLEPGTVTRRDTGWRMSYNLRKVGRTGVAMKMLSWGDPEAKLLVDSRKLNGNEFQLDGVPIVTHMGRSSSRTFGKHAAAKKWEEKVRGWIG